MAELSEREKLRADLYQYAQPEVSVELWKMKSVMGRAAAYLRSEPERLAAVRNEAIEECARVADDHADQNEDTTLGRRRNETARDIAMQVRSLKEPQ